MNDRGLNGTGKPSWGQLTRRGVPVSNVHTSWEDALSVEGRIIAGFTEAGGMTA